MEATNAQNRDDRTYTWAAFTLRTGMFASFGAMLVGLVWWLLGGSRGGQEAAQHVLPFDRIVPELLALNPLALINVGVLLLLATPGITLVAQFVAFALARNWIYAGITAFISVAIGFSVALSLGLITLF
ncbi:MAG TPA: DUF1634 domain-containing protein [Chloroflexia bacterium]|nr:DUF1634 domain-containing protein [Chloroflexia bacterium]